MHTIPSEQSKRFDLALAKRLGMNPEEVTRIDVECDDRDARLTIHAYLPAAEVVEMFNAAGRP
jgi:hypothetical protein